MIFYVENDLQHYEDYNKRVFNYIFNISVFIIYLYGKLKPFQNLKLRESYNQNTH